MKIPRISFKQFGVNANSASDICEFGTPATGSPVYTNNITTLQSSSAWLSGWAAETIASNRPFLEDMNAVCAVFAYMIAYQFQAGVPEYDSGTTYYTNSIVNYSGILYTSLVDNNIGNTPAIGSYWTTTIQSEVTGAVKVYAGASAPTGYLLCQGQAVSRTTYANLYAVTGNAYGAGDGYTTFNIPNLQSNIPVGYNSGDTNFNALGKTGGEKTHTLTQAEIPSYSIPINTTTSSWNSSSDGSQFPGAVGANTSTSINSGGGGEAHNNLQPYVTMNFIIKT